MTSVLPSRLLPALGLLVVALVVAACGSSSNDSSGSAAAKPAASTTGDSASVALRTTALGKILVDGKGQTLYLFEADKGKSSTCKRNPSRPSGPRTGARPEPSGGKNGSQPARCAASKQQPMRQVLQQVQTTLNKIKGLRY